MGNLSHTTVGICPGLPIERRDPPGEVSIGFQSVDSSLNVMNRG